VKQLFYVRRHTCADGIFEWYVLNGHTRRRPGEPFSDESGGRSGAGEVAGEARSGQCASPQANAERLSADVTHNAANQAVVAGR
jgi:hypothetical protein